MTALELIRRSLKLLGVVDANEAPEAEDAQDALDLLNAMFAEWRGAGLMITDFEVSTPATELTISIADKEAVAHQLAKRMAPEYGVSLSAEFVSSADESWRRLEHRYFQPGRTSFRELPVPTGYCYGTYSIERDWP